MLTDNGEPCRKVDTLVHPCSSGSATPTPTLRDRSVPLPQRGAPFNYLTGMKRLGKMLKN